MKDPRNLTRRKSKFLQIEDVCGFGNVHDMIGADSVGRILDRGVDEGVAGAIIVPLRINGHTALGHQEIVGCGPNRAHGGGFVADDVEADDRSQLEQRVAA